MTSLQLDLAPLATTLWDQPVLDPADRTLIQAMSSQFFYENSMGNGVKCFLKIQVDSIHSFSLVQYSGHLVIEGDQVCQAGPAFHKPMLTRPGLLVVHYMTFNGTQMTCSMTFSGTEVRLTGL